MVREGKVEMREGGRGEKGETTTKRQQQKTKARGINSNSAATDVHC